MTNPRVLESRVEDSALPPGASVTWNKLYNLLSLDILIHNMDKDENNVT